MHPSRARSLMVAPSPLGHRTGDFAALLALLGLLIWFWRSRILHHAASVTLAGTDSFVYYVPMYAGLAQAIRGWRVPLWNPFQGCGQPFLGVLSGAVLYPARLLLLFLDPSSALAWSTFLHLAFGGAVMFTLARALGSGIGGALVASLCFTYGFGVTTIYTPTTFLEPGVWWPLAAFALLHLITTGRWRYVALASCAMAAPVLAGGYQIIVYSAYGFTLFMLGLVIDQRHRAAVLTPATIVRLLLVAGLAAALASIQWLPTLLWAREAVRTTHALPVGQIDPWNMPPATAAALLLARRDVLTSMFLPLPAVALALVGLIFGPRLLRPLGIGGVVAFLLSLGPRTPWFGLYYLLPGFSMFRLPSRMHYFVVLAGSLTAAFGVEVLRARARPSRPMRAAVALTLVLGGVLAATLGPPRPGSQKMLSGTLALDRFDGLAAGATLATVLLPPPLVVPAIVGPLALTMISSRANDSLMPYTDPRNLVARHHEAYRRVAAVAALSRTALLSSDPLWVPTTTKQAMMVGLYAPDDYDPLVSRRLSNYLSLLLKGQLPTLGWVPPGAHLSLEGPPAHPRLLDMMSVRYLVISLRGSFALPVQRFLLQYPSLPRFVGRGDAAHLQLRQNLAALPRAYVVRGVRVAGSEEEAVREILAPDFDPRREVVALGRRGAPHPAAGDLVSATIVSYEPERVVIRAQGGSDATLVMTDAYAAGWVAAVDGKPAPLWQANYLFRGVDLPAGDHEIVFEYRAPGYLAGRAGVLAALAVLGAVPLASRLRSRHR